MYIEVGKDEMQSIIRSSYGVTSTDSSSLARIDIDIVYPKHSLYLRRRQGIGTSVEPTLGISYN